MRQRRSRRSPARAPRPAAPAPRAAARDAGARFAWDGALVGCTLVLVGIGVVMNYSTTAAREIGAPLPELAVRHWLGVLAGAVAAVLAARLPLGFWRRMALPAFGVCLLLLCLIPFLGVEANGARRWLAIPGVPIRIQPSEPMRLALVLALSSVLAAAMHRGAPRPAALRAVAPLVLLRCCCCWRSRTSAAPAC